MRTAGGALSVDDVVFRKRCGCQNATASGPRAVRAEARESVLHLVYATLACDRCDTPWTPDSAEVDP